MLTNDLPQEIFAAPATPSGANTAAPHTAAAAKAGFAPSAAAKPAPAIVAQNAVPESGIKSPPPTLAEAEIYDQLCRHLAHTHKTDALAEVENQLISRLLAAANGNYSLVSRFLGMARGVLAKRAAKLAKE
ncbi:MAG: helix-turn-helix domain-containing protein [Puniceicoccales bacterium]|nr:helix-turn-helix domain-containing protein [Puniceicoccales bacterium]